MEAEYSCTGSYPHVLPWFPLLMSFDPEVWEKETLSYLILHLVTIFYHKNRKIAQTTRTWFPWMGIKWDIFYIFSRIFVSILLSFAFQECQVTYLLLLYIENSFLCNIFLLWFLLPNFIRYPPHLPINSYMKPSVLYPVNKSTGILKS